MPLNLKRPLAFIDLETTGINISTDKILEIAILKVNPSGEKEEYLQKVNPEMAIPLEASLVHGIYDADVAQCPTFKEVAASIAQFLENADIAGYNSNRFDVPLLVEEFLRVGIVLCTDNIKFVDVQKIFHLMEKRNLSAAYKFYCGKDLTDAHSAKADVTATYEVFVAQLERYNELDKDIDALHEFTKEGEFVDYSRRMIYENGIPVFNFGKHKGRAVTEVLHKEPTYFNWIMQSDFSLHTKQKLKEIKHKMTNSMLN